MGDLPDSVNIRVSISLTLAIVSSISITIGNREINSMFSIDKMSNTNIATVTISTLHKTVAI